MSSSGTYGMFTPLKWARSMVHISWYIIYCKHNNLEWSIQLRMIWDSIFLYWTINHEYCVSSFFAEYSEGCYLLRRASNYAGYCLHIWFLLNLVLLGFADVYRGCDGRLVLIGQTKRRNVVMFHVCIWNRILQHLVSCYLQVPVYRVLWIKVQYEYYICCRL